MATASFVADSKLHQLTNSPLLVSPDGVKVRDAIVESYQRFKLGQRVRADGETLPYLICPESLLGEISPMLQHTYYCGWSRTGWQEQELQAEGLVRICINPFTLHVL